MKFLSARLAFFRSLLVLLAVVVGLVLVEVSFRVFTPNHQFLDERTEHFWQTRMRDRLASGKEPTWNIEYDSNLGWRMQRRIPDEARQTNSLGFRGTREYGANSDRQRIFVVGASMTQGLALPLHHTFPTLLEKQLGVEVINAGANAYGTDQALLMWETEGRRLNPDLLLFGYHVDGFFRNGLRIRDLPKPYFDVGADGCELKGVPVVKVSEVEASGLIDGGSAIRIGDALKWVLRKGGDDIERYQPERAERLVQLNDCILERLRDTARESGARLIVILNGHCSDGILHFAFSERSILASASRLGIEVVNMIEAMRGSDYRSFFGDDCHWNEEGQKFVAKELIDALSIQ